MFSLVLHWWLLHFSYINQSSTQWCCMKRPGSVTLQVILHFMLSFSALVLLALARHSLAQPQATSQLCLCSQDSHSSSNISLDSALMMIRVQETQVQSSQDRFITQVTARRENIVPMWGSLSILEKISPLCWVFLQWAAALKYQTRWSTSGIIGKQNRTVFLHVKN
jgi:hypothetical protein